MIPTGHCVESWAILQLMLEPELGEKCPDRSRDR